MTEKLLFVVRDEEIRGRIRSALDKIPATPIFCDSVEEMEPLLNSDRQIVVAAVSEGAIEGDGREYLIAASKQHAGLRFLLLCSAGSPSATLAEAEALWILPARWEARELAATMKAILSDALQSEPGSIPDLGQMSVMVVEDNAADALLLCEQLQQSGVGESNIAVYTALDKAIAALIRKRPDFIFTDLSLPDAEGLKSVEALRAAAPKTPMVVLSGTTDEAIAVQALKLGAQDYLLKHRTDREALSRALRYSAERKRSELRLAHMAHYDTLTGLQNRSTFRDRMTRAIQNCRRHKDRLAIVFIDMDGFKKINDELGHEIGDRFLREVSGRFRRAIRGDDVVSRWGGDEFVVLLENLRDADQAGAVARRIQRRIAMPLEIAGHLLTPACSAGIAIYPEHGETIEELLNNADQAMYSAKRERTSLALAGGTQHDPLELLLEQALARDEFKLHYQPQLDLTTGRLVAMEALLRWQPAGHELMPPGRFIPRLESNGMIYKVGRWVLRTACHQAAAWRKSVHPDLRISVNLSAKEIATPGIAFAIAEALESSGLPPAALELELTEDGLAQSVDTVAMGLNRLRDLGVRVAIDDFGKGQTSLSHLDRFHVDTLKIDQSFIQSSKNCANREIIKAIVGLGHSLGLTVVGEGVETVDQLSCLEELGCSLVQGYLLGRPADAGAWRTPFNPAEQFLSGSFGAPLTSLR